MALTEQTILRAVTVRPDVATIEVEWRREIRDGDELITSIPHRKAYGADQAAEFQAEVEGAAPYAAAVGWRN